MKQNTCGCEVCEHPLLDNMIIKMCYSQALRLDMKEQTEEHELALKEKEREHQQEKEKKEQEHQQEKKEMEIDIAKLVKLVDKLKKKLARLGECR